jgi:mannose-1-phosphate guanylyltransferase
VTPINAQAAELIKTLSPLEEKYRVKFIYSQKEEALGTAGPIKFAEKELKEGNKEGVFFVFNSDVICNYPLE